MTSRHRSCFPRTFSTPSPTASAAPRISPPGVDASHRRLPAVLQPPRFDHRLARFVGYSCRRLASYVDLSDRQCAAFGLSARQLRRLSNLYLGLSPRRFARVLRFQRSLGTLSSGAWADLYYDQPHFVREFKRMSGLAPGDFVNSSVLYNREPG